MNKTLTEKIRAMLRTAGLPNSFWAEAAKTACYIVNRSPSTAIGLKTVMEMWTGKPVDYSYLHAFGCPVYVMYNAQERTKLDSKSRRCIFLGYADGVKRRDEDDSTVKEKSETVLEEIEALHKNKTWELVPLPHERKAIGNKWVYKIKRDGNDQVERYRARLVLDVKTAFVNGELEEEIYMLQPKGFAEKENLVCRLNKSLYGLKQAPRPDIAQAVGAINRYMRNPGGEHWITVKRILKYIKRTLDVALCYRGSEFIVRGYVDSDFAGDLDKRKSTTGYVFTLAGATVSRVSKLQTVVALSTTEAEYMAATQACKEAIWIQRLLEELGHKQQKILVFCDS
ncbi:Integrase catalytic domain-containing protein [Citrus sinensis]|nr:Integrase catalytic domain-containing protein [Citrus sinensis]